MADKTSSEPTRNPSRRAEKRAQAAAVLDSPELLMMFAHSSGDVSCLSVSLLFSFLAALCADAQPREEHPRY